MADGVVAPGVPGKRARAAGGGLRAHQARGSRGLSELVRELVAICGDANVFWKPEDTMVFEYDAGFDRRPPLAVVVPASADEISRCVKAARRAGVAVVPRGAGTGLSGGTIACNDAVVIATARLRTIHEIDPVARVAIVDPGVPNLEVSAATKAHGLFFAPDPASQRVSSVGGNIGTNAGGPHALKYGSVVDHVLAVEMVLPDGEIAVFGGVAPDLPGYDCVPLIVGSEGTLGIVTKAWLRLLPLPEDVRTFLAEFPDVRSGARAASAVIARGFVPAAMEMLDRTTIRAVNAAFDVHLNEDSGSMLLIEVEGLREETESATAAIVAMCEAEGATKVRVAQTQAERDLLWKARKLGYPALARIKPNSYIHDAVVPRSKLPDVLDKVNAIADRYGYVIANMFHIGDGNLHPLLLFDLRTDTIDKVMEASAEIMKVAIEAGGALSGEHGIGIEKNHFMFWVYGPEDLEAMQRARSAFDPDGVMNPGKVFPGGDVCAAIPTERLKRALADGMWI